MARCVREAVHNGFTHVAFGDLFLEDVRRYREDRLAGSGLEPLFPLWGRPTDALAREMISSGLEARLTCIDQRVLAKEFVGRRYDSALLAELPPGTDPCGERGEFHTCAIAGPMFAERIDVDLGEIVSAVISCLRIWRRRDPCGNRGRMRCPASLRRKTAAAPQASLDCKRRLTAFDGSRFNRTTAAASLFKCPGVV